MKNCHLETLFCNEQGFVSLCACCGTIHLGFGNFMLVVAHTDLPQFLQNMEHNLRRRSVDTDNTMLKNIVIPTPTREVSLLFCLEELRRFVAFLTQAQSKLLIKALAKEGANSAGTQLN